MSVQKSYQFRGKYAQMYAQMGQVIRDTVKEAQDNMANIGRQIEDWPEWMPLYGPLDWESYCFGLPFQYPQSLGELCLEVAQEYISEEQKGWPIAYDCGEADVVHPGVDSVDSTEILCHIDPRKAISEIPAMRRTLYRRPENH